MNKILLLLLLFPFMSIAQEQKLELNLDYAKKLGRVPMDCIHTVYPNKLNQTLADSSHIQSPKELHPIFYGCFDWHSSVHGHWLLASMMNEFPQTPMSEEIEGLFDDQFQIPNVQKELAYFMPKVNQSFERTYGWAWYLKLIATLHQNPLNVEHKWTKNLQSLTNYIVEAYQKFLPKLVYPIRVGEHTNTAFGLSLALDYARAVGNVEFENMIVQRAKDFYLEDQACPINWEPSGFDFISPCLQEAELMAKVLDEKEYKKWISDFLPQLLEDDFELAPGKVLDRTDGKLVHLDGLNFSRAWCLYSIAEAIPKNRNHLIQLGDKHLLASMDYVIGADYMGSHWLASFLVYALQNRSELIIE